MDTTLFILALLAAYAIPGPDMVLVLQACAAGGNRPAISAALGLACARAVHVTLAALGLAALVQTSETAFQTVRVAGAVYLAWLGWNLLRHAGKGSLGVDGTVTAGLASWRRYWLRGLLTNLSNPKALLFCSMLLPQFVHPAQGGVGGRFALLGGILVMVGLACDAVIIGAGSRLARISTSHPAAETALYRGFGILMLGFALRLLLA